jgi:hypothetical protein
MEEDEITLSSINHLLRFLSLRARSSLSCVPSGMRERYGLYGRGWLTGPFPSRSLLGHPFSFYKSQLSERR